MPNLFCYKDDHLVTIYQRGSFQAFGHMIVSVDEDKYKIDEVYLIGDKESLTIDDVRFQCMDQKERFGFLDLRKSCVLGRDRMCDVVFDDEHVSSFHARIENGWIYDQKSTNGTYVNGQKITSHQLSSFDWICIAGHHLIVCGSYCLCHHSKLDHRFVSKGLIDEEDHGSNIPTSFESPIQKLSLQIFASSDPIKKGSLFSAIGSSVLILVSSIVTSFVSFLMMRDMNSLFSMAMTSGSMSLAFLGYGLIMRKIQYKEQVNMHQEKKQAYLLYLEEMEQKIKEMYRSLVTSEQIREAFINDRTLQTYHFFQNTDRLCALPVSDHVWLDLQLPLINYTQKQDPMYKELENFIANQPTSIKQRTWILSSSKDLYALPFSSIKAMFCQWAWQAGQEDVEWIFLLDANIHDRMFGLPYCSLNTKRKKARVIWVAETKDASCMLSQDLFIGLNEIDLPKAELDLIVRKLYLKQYEEQAKKPSLEHALVSMGEYANLNVCIGYERSQTIWLDLHESKDGPHGLIAGTTGSGKSEWLISVLMQLAYNNSSKALEYVLIDFKGGAFGTMLSRFAHCAGMLTNLSMIQIDRLEKGLQRELDTRQMILKEFITLHPDQKAHIDSYNAYFKEAKMSHLLIVVDEFAQLKLKAPDFMQHLKEIARIGRSLGIHLILSTQKPMGVIDEQIWSNSRFKVCLKVNDAMDSQEVIHSDRACKLVRPGQFILHTASQQGLQEGQGFYMHTAIKDRERIEIYDPSKSLVFCTKDPSITLYQKLADEILARDLPARKILLAPLEELTSFDSLFVVDRPDLQAYGSIDITKYASIGLLVMDEKLLKEWLLALMAHYQDHVIYRKGYRSVASMFEEYTGQSEDEKIILLDFSHERTTIKNGCCIHIYEGVDSSLSYAAFHELLFAFGIQDIEACCLFFSSYKLPQVNFEKHLGLVKHKDRIDPCIFSNQTGQVSMINEADCSTGIYLGKDVESNRSLFWQDKKSLVIVYVQKSMERWIQDHFFEFDILWHGFDGQAKICVLSAIADMDILSSSEFNQWQYDIDLMWIGLGYEDYGYCLHRKASFEIKSDAILWQKDSVYCLNW